MKRLILLCAAASLTGCATVAKIANVPASPAAVCDKTTLDEQAGIAAEAGYKAFRTVIETWVDMGLMKPATARAIRPINTKLFNLTLTEQAAYKACNSASYFGAIGDIKALLVTGYATLGVK